MIKQALERGRPPPAHLLEGPEIEEAALPYWKAFWTLNGGRLSIPGFSVVLDQPIPVSEMEAYARGRVGYETEFERDAFIEIMQAMDRKYREIVQDERTNEAKRRSGKKQ